MLAKMIAAQCPNVMQTRESTANETKTSANFSLFGSLLRTSLIVCSLPPQHDGLTRSLCKCRGTFLTRNMHVPHKCTRACHGLSSNRRPKSLMAMLWLTTLCCLHTHLPRSTRIAHGLSINRRLSQAFCRRLHYKAFKSLAPVENVLYRNVCTLLATAIRGSGRMNIQNIQLCLVATLTRNGRSGPCFA